MKRVYEGNSPYLFISYAHRNTDTVVPIVEELVDRGFRVWYDAGIEAGTEWPEYIADHLRRSATCICFVSEEFLSSQNCTRELGFATKIGNPPFIVYLGEPKLSLGMQMRLGTMQAIYLDRHSTMESFINELVRAECIKKCHADAGREDYYSDAIIEAKTLHQKKKYAAAREILESAAKSGNADAEYLYALCILDENAENRTDTDHDIALDHLLRAARSGNIDAQYILTQKFDETEYEQLGKSKHELLKAAAVGGNADAMYMFSYEFAKSGEYLSETALYWTERAAENGNIKAINALSKNRKTEHGREWLRRAAGMGYAQAQFELSREYLTGEHFEKSDELSLEWCRIAAENGHSYALFYLAERYDEGNGVERDYKKALDLYEKSIENPHTYAIKQDALVAIGDLFYHGRGVEKSVQRAIEYYERAGNYVEAKYRIAICMFKGEIFDKPDRAKAIEMIRELEMRLRKSRAHAQNLLGWCYENGIEVDKDHERAVRYYRASADKNFPAGIYSLAACLENGIGTEKDTAAAIENYKRAAQLGHSGAKLALERITKSEKV